MRRMWEGGMESIWAKESVTGGKRYGTTISKGACGTSCILRGGSDDQNQTKADSHNVLLLLELDRLVWQI